MEDCSGNFVISFNGEIYNFRELKRDLEARYGPIPWRSETDTEVVVEGFAREGRIFLNRLNGMFALAIFDKASGVLHVLRDPLGIKPLFVTHQGGAVFFCSELKGLLVFPELRRTLRLQSVAEQLSFMYVPEPATLFWEFAKLEPGVCVSYREGRQVASIKLFSWLEEPLRFASDEEALDAFYQGVQLAIARQLVADAPLSLMLSGGLDSSAVALEGVRHGGNVRDAYTIAISETDRVLDRQSDDLRYARRLAAQLGIELHVIDASPGFMELLPSLGPFLEDGIGDPSAINTYIISRAAARNGVKVLLTGQGADEFLGGYRRYRAAQILARVPQLLRSPMRLAARGIPPSVPGPLNALARRARRFATLASLPRDQRLVGLYTWCDSASLRALFKKGDLLAPVGQDLLRLFDSLTELDDLEAMMRVDQHFDLRSLNLTYTDRFSMAAGVEARVPFLDFELVRIMNSLPSGLKIRGSVAKYPLKRAMERQLPSEIIHREKTGFGLPIRAWMRRPSALVEYYLDRCRIERQGIFDAEAVDRMRLQHVSGAADHAHVLFSLLCFQVWVDIAKPDDLR
jgi:asparagine synthase (glutamine-hydrolysing)